MERGWLATRLRYKGTYMFVGAYNGSSYVTDMYQAGTGDPDSTCAKYLFYLISFILSPRAYGCGQLKRLEERILA